MQDFLFILLCYFIGAIPFSYLFSRFLGGTDIREKGSGNVGATNVLRTSGVGVAVLALVGDLLKGLLAAWIGLTAGGEILAALCGGAAVIGHCWTPFLSFRGGKGVATAGGVLFFLMPRLTLILLIVLITIFIVTRYVSLGSITVAAILPILTILFGKSLAYILLGFFLAVLIIAKHHENIRRLRQGTESKINEKAT